MKNKVQMDHATIARLGGKAAWAGVSKAERRKRMQELAKRPRPNARKKAT